VRTRSLSGRHQDAVESRGLSAEKAVAMGLYSGTLLRDGSVEPDDEGRVLCIPYWEGDVEVNTKYRWTQDGERRFMQRKGAVKTLYNANAILDDELLKELEAGTAELIWTEGEFDCQAAIEAGYAHTVSVPDGAPPARDKNGKLIHVPEDDRDIDPEDDDKFSFMARHMERLLRVKHHVIATDNDEPGRRLAKELVRRLGPARCKWVEYPTDEVVTDKKTGKKRPCKDLNEVSKHLGPKAIYEMVTHAREWPVKGLFKLSQYPDVAIPAMCDVGIDPKLDELMKIYQGQFIVITGLPNMGKSTFWNQVTVQMAKIHKWPQAVFSGEKDVKPFLAQEYMTAFLGKAKADWTFEEKKRAEAFVERYYSFIDYDPVEVDDSEIDIDFILDKAATAVFRYGVKMLTVDPWNELEHNRTPSVSLTEYVGKSIKKMKRFAKQFGCAVAVVAHPTKMDPSVAPGLYNISDSAHWANKADLGVVIHGEDPMDSTDRTIAIPKVRLKRIAGNTGTADIQFDLKTHLFKPKDF
jgi:twinkle protein